MKPARLGPLAAVLLLALAGGCERRTLYEYGDEAYLGAVRPGERGRLLKSVYRDDRELALRSLALQARHARAAGEAELAAELVRPILEHCREREEDGRVLSLAVGVCLPEAGVDESFVRDFLRERLLRGEALSDACLALCTLFPAAAYADVAPFLEHPRPAVRYGAALALSCLPDPRVPRRLAALAETMQRPAWPAEVQGVPLAECRRSLRERARARRGAGAAP